MSTTRALRRLARGDLGHRWLASLLFVLVVALASAGIVAGLLGSRGASDLWDDLRGKADAADIVLAVNARDLADDLARRPEVESAAEPFPLAYRNEVSGGSEPIGIAGLAEVPERAHPVVLEGRWVETDDEVVVERSFALDAGIAVGDQVQITSDDATLDQTVVGLAVEPVDCLYPECTPPWMAWVRPEVLDRLAPTEDRRAWVQPLFLEDPDTVAQFEASAQAQLGDDLRGTWDWIDTRDDVLAANRFFAVFLGTFGVFLLIAASLVIGGTAGSQVVSRWRELGMLKALGFTPSSLAWLLLVQQVVLAVVGVALGLLVGALLSPRLQLHLGEVLGAGSARLPFGTIVTTLVIVLAVVLVATLVPARRAARVPAAEAVTRAGGTGRARPSRLGRLAGRLRLGPAAVAGLKDAFARPVRATLAIATLVLTVVVATVTLAFSRTVDGVVADPGRTGDPYDAVVVPVGAPVEELAAEVDARPEVRSWFTATQRRGSSGDETFVLRALGGDLERAGFIVREGRMPAAAGEAVAGYGLLERLGWEVGDREVVRWAGADLPVTIVGWYAEAEDAGEVLQLRFDDVREAVPDTRPGDLFVRAAPGVGRDELVATLQTALGARAEVLSAEEGSDDLNAFGLAFFTITLLVLCVCVANLVAGTTLGVRERQRDLAVLKAIGFTPRQVAVSVAAGVLALGVVALLIGLPIGLLLGRALLDLVSSEIGVGPGLGAWPTVGGLVVASLGLLAVTLVVGLASSRRAARAEVAEVLREE